jgi:hypothetical protein
MSHDHALDTKSPVPAPQAEPLVPGDEFEDPKDFELPQDWGCTD